MQSNNQVIEWLRANYRLSSTAPIDEWVSKHHLHQDFLAAFLPTLFLHEYRFNQLVRKAFPGIQTTGKREHFNTGQGLRPKTWNKLIKTTT